MKYLALFIGVALPLSVFGAVMGSTNYSIESDSVNFGGGLSTSSNYSAESTLGESATGNSESATYKLHAGYQQMIATYISLSVSPVTLTPAIPANGGGVANGATNVTVATDNKAGYELYIAATSSPALVSGINSFADYVPAGINPDFVFSVLPADSAFGFSPEGQDIVQAFQDDSFACGVGSFDSVNSCWKGLTTSDVLIAKKTSGNHPSGTITTLKFRAESGVAHVQPAGTYTATSTVTVIAL